MGRLGLLVVCVSACALGGTYSAQSPDRIGGKVDFQRDVQPIFRQNCYGCHGPSQQMNGFRLDRRRDALRGGTIPVIGPGNSEGSRLYLRLTGNRYGPQMPPTGPLPSEHIATIKAWIDQGAQWPDEASGETPAQPPDPIATRLMAALRAGDRGGFASQAHADPKACSRKGAGGATPLMYAVLYGDASAVKLLLDLEADPNVANEAGATALMWAGADLEKMRLLLDRGASVNARSDDGRTPLMIAAGVPGAAPAVKLLLERGANVLAKAPSLFGVDTPLVEAAYSGDEEIFRLLIEHGADANVAGPVTLGFSLRAQCIGCVERLLPLTAPPLITAAMFAGGPPIGPALATNLLLARGADPSGRDPEGRTMLMLAAASDAQPLEAVKALIERGVDVNAASPGGETALAFAKRHGRTAVVEALLKAGARDDVTASAPSAAPSPAASIRAAVERSLPLLQDTDDTFLRKAGCVSCHNNTLTAMTAAVARQRGLPVNDVLAQQQVKKVAAYLETWRERALQGIGIPGDADTVSYILMGLAAEKYPADAATDAMARLLKREQAPDGHWRILAHRPPLESNDIEVTAASMRALQAYAPRPQAAEYREAVNRAASWLGAASPRATEERAFQLLGLVWSRAAKTAIATAARALVAEQRPDGGWAQCASLNSDAYATGQALVALDESREVPVSHPAFVRGVQFLRKTQAADGSWFVARRALPIQPHFESGFPHGRDQFISAAATNWAVQALARSYVKPS